MRSPLARHLVLGLLVLGATTPLTAQTSGVMAGGQEPERGPTAGDILDRALARAARQDTAGTELDFESVLISTIDSLDGDGAPTKTETARYRRYPLEGLLFDELIEIDGRPLDADEIRDEANRQAKFVREAQEHAARGETYEPDERAVRFDAELMERYTTTLVGTDVVGDHACWVLAFEPRDGSLPDTRQMDKALNRSTGRLWIAQDDYGLARISFQMQQPFRYLWVWSRRYNMRKDSWIFSVSRATSGHPRISTWPSISGCSSAGFAGG
ncbi:MAG: hypothetical protein O3A25_06565 [Acidobacteria bacterium]|nr:hypothetical protein [Acidobacteriota bacterium]